MLYDCAPTIPKGTFLSLTRMKVGADFRLINCASRSFSITVVASENLLRENWNWYTIRYGN